MTQNSTHPAAAARHLTALRSLRAAADRTLRRSIHDDEREALDVAIAALEQEENLLRIAYHARVLADWCDFAEPLEDEDERGDHADVDLSNGDVDRIARAREQVMLSLRLWMHREEMAKSGVGGGLDLTPVVNSDANHLKAVEKP